MNHAQIDMLLQLPVPRPEPSPAARSRDDAPIFDNQLRLASDGGDVPTSPPLAPSSRQPSEPLASQSRPSTQTERPPANDDSAPTPAATESQSEPAAEEVCSTDDENQDDDAPQDEAAEVAALLAAAEQVTKTTLTDPAKVAADGESTADDVDVEAIKSAEKPAQNPHHAGKSPAPAPTGDAPRKAQATAAIVPNAAAKDDQAKSLAAGTPKLVESAEASSDESNPAPAIALAETEVSPQAEVAAGTEETTKAKPHRAGEPHEVATDAKAAEKQPAANAQPIAQATAATAGPSKLATDDAPKKSDRKTSVREPAAVGDPSTRQSEHAAATARASEPPAAPPVVANVQQQLAAPAAASVAATEAVAKPGDATSAAKPGLLSPFARLERGANGTHRAGKGETAHNVDPARFVSRVARAVQTAQERGAPLQLRLSPPELGAMRLELSVNQGNLTATIETDNANARQLLLDNLPALRERLAEQNVKIERFDVDVRRDPTGSQQNPGAQDRGNPEQNERGSGRQGAAPRGPNRQTIDETQPIRRIITNNSINVVA